MSWGFKGGTHVRVEPSFLGPLVPARVLIEYDGPALYTSILATGATILVYRADDELDVEQWIAAEISAERLSDLCACTLPLRDALFGERTYALDVRRSNGRIVAAWSIESEADIPSGYLPIPGIMLNHELRPEFVEPAPIGHFTPEELGPNAKSAWFHVADRGKGRIGYEVYFAYFGTRDFELRSDALKAVHAYAKIVHDTYRRKMGLDE